MTWDLPQHTDTETQAAVVAGYTALADWHYGLALGAASRDDWDLFAAHQVAMDRVLAALRREAYESPSWSTVG